MGQFRPLPDSRRPCIISSRHCLSTKGNDSVSTLISGGINLIIFVVMLGVLVFVHELGHFATAKRLGIPVPEFGLGFPPRIARFWRGSGWIEIQGRRIFIPRDFNLPQNVQVGSQVWYKTKTEKGREILTSLEVVDDESRGTTLTSPVQNLDRGTEYTINAIPLGGFVRLMGEEDPSVPGGFASAKPSVRAPILLAGVTMNVILAFIVFTFTSYASPPYVTIQTTRVLGVVANSPAAEAGLRAGDYITTVNGQDVADDYPALRDLLRQNAGHAVTLTVLRNNQPIDPVKVTPRANPPAGEGPLGIALNGWAGLSVNSVEPGSVADKAGVRAGDVLVFLPDPKKPNITPTQEELAAYVKAHPGWKIEWRLLRDKQVIGPISVQIPDAVTAKDATLGLNLTVSLLDAPRKSLEQMGLVITSIPMLIGQMMSGSVPANSFVGPVGIYQVTGEVAQRGGPVALLDLLGLLSMNLAIVNLLPFPALDGGRLVFVVLEWLRGGKKIDPQKEGLVHLVGIMVLLGLMVIISFFDLQRLFSGQSIFPSP